MFRVIKKRAGLLSSYFIIGLPRSRTAWLSMFMSQSNTYCYHDGFNGCNNLGEYWSKVEGCGDSSTGLMLVDINKLKPNSPIVVIDKNEAELKRCIEFCSEVCGQDSESAILELNEKLKKINGLHIQQSEINSNLKRIWKHLVKDDWKTRHENMINFNIQIIDLNIDEVAASNLMGSL